MNFWMLLVAGAVIVAAIVIGLILGTRRNSRDRAIEHVRVARAERLRELPAFGRALHRRALALAGALLLGAITIAAAGVVAARPISSETIQPVNTSRDIMLCLDVSGSMSDVDVEVLSVFEDLLEGFRGERIGLTIFNSTPVQVFPLTDDYDFIQKNLESIRESFDYSEAVPEHWVGTLNGNGSSLVGDGLTGCALGFDRPDDDRSRSIIFATDNEVRGASIVELDEAAAFAKSLKVRVFALDPVQGLDVALSDQLVRAAEITGGTAYGLRDTTTVDDIITEVQEQDATLLRGQAQVVWTDTPNLWIVVMMVTALSFTIVLWRMRL